MVPVFSRSPPALPAPMALRRPVPIKGGEVAPAAGTVVLPLPLIPRGAPAASLPWEGRVVPATLCSGKAAPRPKPPPASPSHGQVCAPPDPAPRSKFPAPVVALWRVEFPGWRAVVKAATFTRGDVAMGGGLLEGFPCSVPASPPSTHSGIKPISWSIPLIAGEFPTFASKGCIAVLDSVPRTVCTVLLPTFHRDTGGVQRKLGHARPSSDRCCVHMHDNQAI